MSRNFTFRVQEDASPAKKKKKRVRRPDAEEEGDVDLGKHVLHCVWEHSVLSKRLKHQGAFSATPTHCECH